MRTFFDKEDNVKKGIFLSAIILSGCANTKNQFYENKYALRDATICRAYFSELGKADYRYLGNLRDEIDRRRISPDDCRVIIDNANAASTDALVGALNAANTTVQNNQRQYQPVQPIGMTWFLQSEQTNGSLRYCKYSNGAIQTFSISNLCPQSIKQ
jgi:hypothetical protein